MSEKNIFEVAAKNKYRFPFKGVVSVEDLWDMSMPELDSVFGTLNSQLEQSQKTSLLSAKTQQSTELDTKIEIVKYIFNVKVEEEVRKRKAQENREKKQKYLEVLAEKQNNSLKDKSIEEIEAMLDELGE